MAGRSEVLLLHDKKAVKHVLPQVEKTRNVDISLNTPVFTL